MTNDYKLEPGALDLSQMDAATPIRNWPAQFPSQYQAGGHLEGLRTDAGLWTPPADRDTYFFEAEQIVEAGDRHLVPLGPPYLVWVFPIWTEDQLGYARARLCAKPALSAEATARTRLEDGSWGTYTGALHWPRPGSDMTRGNGVWLNVTLYVRDLQEVTA